jgi:GGDEF domain-containing protein
VKNSSSYAVLLLSIFVLVFLLLLSLLQVISLQSNVDNERNISLEVFPRIKNLIATNESISNTIEDGMNNQITHHNIRLELNKLNTINSSILLPLSSKISTTKSHDKFQAYLKQLNILKQLEHQVSALLKYGHDNPRVIFANNKWKVVNNNINKNLQELYTDIINENMMTYENIIKTKNTIIFFICLSLLTTLLIGISIYISIKVQLQNDQQIAPLITDDDLEIDSSSIFNRDILFQDLSTDFNNSSDNFSVIATQIKNTQSQKFTNDNITTFLASHLDKDIKVYLYQKDEYIFIIPNVKHEIESIGFCKQLSNNLSTNSITMNIGISHYPETSMNIDILLNSAIRAMLESKSCGMNSIITA